VYNLLPRVLESKRFGKEKLAGGGLNNRQLNDYVQSGPLTQFFQAPDTVWTPRVLKDGADSVGVLGALNRVYLNIGTFSEEWLLHFNALVGGKPISPIPIETARKNSAYFKATEAQTMDTARFFLRTTGPHHLADAPDGNKYLNGDNATLARGKNVFAETCARCHSSKLPAMVQGLDPDGCVGPNYMQCWNRYWASTQTDEFKKQMRDIVNAPDFLDGNYLSAEFRVPVTLLETNACSPLATNAIEDNVWDNFSSRSYKDLPSVGSITYYDPFTGEPHQYVMPAGGRGYTRPPSLISVWSSAPFLLNNTVGHFEPSPSIEARMRAFDDGIEQMLWPEKRTKDSVLGDKIPGVIDRVGDRLPPGHETERVYLKVDAGYLPDVIANSQGVGRRLFPWLFGGEGIQIGPVPRGTPIGLLSNLKLLAESSDDRVKHDTQLADVLLNLIDDLKKLGPNATDEQARGVFSPELGRKLLALSKCPDLVVNRGHKFGTTLPDEDKRALIALLKTF
jgi:cytochrome c2